MNTEGGETAALFNASILNKTYVTEKDRYSPAVVVTVFLYALIQVSANQLNISCHFFHRQISKTLQHLLMSKDE